MITFEDTRDLARIKPFIFDEKLSKCVLDEDVQVSEDKFELCPATTYLIAKSNEEDVGMFRLTYLASSVIIVHIHILPKHWGTGLADKVGDEFISVIQERTAVRKIIAFVPKTATNVIHYLFRFFFSLSGILKHAVKYQGKITDLHMFEYTFIRGK